MKHTLVLAVAALGLALSACELPEEDAADALDDAAGRLEDRGTGSAGPQAGGSGSEDTGGTEFTPEQDNAIRAGLDYLEFSGFSRDGLIQQLSSAAGDGYPRKVAVFAVTTIEKQGAVDWKAEAVESARGYLDFSTFSCDGLIEQLSSAAGDGFTREEATFAARKVDLC
ncbi:Ltp family lipoprotein [Nocardioides sp.]|uniref:Ltp family lipoprotein n=1 Tax=Nocardioides sp. TaxID=35761 RepID=UPI003516540F